MRTKILIVEVVILFMALVLSYGSFYVNRKDICEPRPDAVVDTNGVPKIDYFDPNYCEESGFPIVLKTGGFSDTQPRGGLLTTFVGNSGFYFIILNLGYFVFKKVRT